MNANQKRLLLFAIQFRGWETIGEDNLADLQGLERDGFVDIENGKYRLCQTEKQYLGDKILLESKLLETALEYYHIHSHPKLTERDTKTFASLIQYNGMTNL